jgi:hypothetical protein
VRLTDRFENRVARAELEAEQQRRRHIEEAAVIHDQRVLYDLMGETQRQALLDQTMAEMEAMALSAESRLVSHDNRRKSERKRRSPTLTHRLSVPQDSEVKLLPQRRLSALSEIGERQDVGMAGEDSDEEDAYEEEENDGETTAADADDIAELRAMRDRQRQQQHRKSVELSGSPCEPHTHIRWQKSAHVRVAMNIPPVLLSIDDDQHDDTILQERPFPDLFPLSEEDVREQQHPASPLDRQTEQRNPRRSPKKSSMRKQLYHDVFHPSLGCATSPSMHRVKKAVYGSWYVPRDEWWPLHEAQQETLAELFPREQPPPTERHTCMRQSPNQNRHSKEASPLALPHAWPSVLRSPSPASLRVAPLARAPPTTSNRRSPLPTSPRSCSTAYTLFSASPVAPPTVGKSSFPGRSRSYHGNSTGHDLVAASTKKASLAAAAPDAIARRAAVLQQEIPQAYIAREYRNYLAANGKRVPSYLNN